MEGDSERETEVGRSPGGLHGRGLESLGPTQSLSRVFVPNTFVSRACRRGQLRPGWHSHVASSASMPICVGAGPCVWSLTAHIRVVCPRGK